ncbi:hypothetical protein BG011_008763 [Mortierella polycephala]|uniref:Uncharacterized protein n=1 Tax=Mortierella polycephala TaxID=41804 RepID=A0A9P6QDD1_9FUNG|nr:hypothetical protein BG011_008763 [Mortierella polycephala]
MSLDGRASSGAVIDQDQLDAKLTRLIMDHNNYRTTHTRYIRHLLSICGWHVDQDFPSFIRKFDQVDRLTSVVIGIRDHALQSYQAVERTGSGLLSQVDSLLANTPIAGPNVLPGGVSPSSAHHTGPKGIMAMNGHHEHISSSSSSPASQRDYIRESSGPAGAATSVGMPFNNNRLLYMAGEVKEAIRFWRDQCSLAQSIEPKVFEIDRITEMRHLALTGDGSTVEEKARAVRISFEQSRQATNDIECRLLQWLETLSVMERSRDDQTHVGAGPTAAAIGHIPHGLSLDHRSMSSHSLGSPAASYLSQPWSQAS